MSKNSVFISPKPNLLINNVNEFQNLNELTIYWHYLQQYKFIHDNIINLIYHFDKVNMNNIYICNIKKITLGRILQKYDEVYYYKDQSSKKNQIYNKFYNNNIFQQFDHTYDQLIDIIMMFKTKLFNMNKRNI